MELGAPVVKARTPTLHRRPVQSVQKFSLVEKLTYTNIPRAGG